MKDYLERLFSGDSFKTWYELFYNYPNDLFDSLDKLSKDIRAVALNEENRDRKPGTWRWHPQHFIGTPEEGMIDALLGRLNTLGDYYERGMLSAREIGGVAEFYLFGVLNCHAFQAYIHRLRQGFRGETNEFPLQDESDGNLPRTAVRKKFGSPPYRHLCVLLRDLDQLRESDEHRVYSFLNKAVEEDIKRYA